MYKKHRLVQVHTANTDLIPANGGILAGCGFAVHYLKAMIKEDVNEEGNELIHFVDDMVLFKEYDTEVAAVEGIIQDVDDTNGRLTDIGQRLNDGKEEIFVPFKSMDKIWRERFPDYKGKVGQAVVDLGITHRTHNVASLNKGKRVADTNKVVKRAQALALA
eukprot:9257156-Heterocapsa_arctica.AAC.1